MVAEMRARWQEPELFNAARGRPAWQSSTRANDTTLGPAQGTNGRAGKRGFFATEREARPWWMVELEADWPIHSIRIHGRRGASARGVTGLEVSISSDQRQWDVIAAGIISEAWHRQSPWSSACSMGIAHGLRSLSCRKGASWR
jgi:hypothetical protein